MKIIAGKLDESKCDGVYCYLTVSIIATGDCSTAYSNFLTHFRISNKSELPHFLLMIEALQGELHDLPIIYKEIFLLYY